MYLHVQGKWPNKGILKNSLYIINAIKKYDLGVPVVAQQLTNLTSVHENSGSIPGLIHWVKDPVLP